MRSNLTLATLVLGALTLAPALHAQDRSVAESILTAPEIRELVKTRAAERRGHRAALDAFLEREDVRRIARDAGIEIHDVRTASASLDDEDLRRLAPRLREAEAGLAGGDTIVLSSTAVIIGLLVLILILVA